jgi:hypothetical protein
MYNTQDAGLSRPWVSLGHDLSELRQALADHLHADNTSESDVEHDEALSVPVRRRILSRSWATTAEGVQIQLIRNDGNGAWRWKAVHGHPGRGVVRFSGDPPFSPGDHLTAWVVATGTMYEVVQLISAPRHVRLERPKMRTSPHEDLANAPLAPGDLLYWTFRYSKSDGSRCIAKKRPCVVREVTPEGIVVMPIYRRGGSIDRTGGGRRILNYKAAGLKKPSVVSAETHLIPLGAVRRVGQLTAEDRRRLLSRPVESLDY